jgi:hypothetical protein
LKEKVLGFFESPWSKVIAYLLVMLGSVLMLGATKGTLDTKALYKTVVSATSEEDSPLMIKINAMDNKLDKLTYISDRSFVTLIAKQAEKIKKKDYEDIKDADLAYINEFWQYLDIKYQTDIVKKQHEVIMDYYFNK